MPLLRMETNPTTTMVYDCWDKITSDSDRAQYLADTHPQSGAEFVAICGETILPCVAYMRDDPAALLWLFDIALVVPQMTPLSAQIGMYILPEWRDRSISPECAEVMRDALASYGFAHLSALVRLDDDAARDAMDACQFTYHARLPRWQRYGGVWHNMGMYGRHFKEK